jgi:cyclopropane-fatty-acyl-phospholipid synthase
MNSETASLAIDLPSLARLPWYQRRLVDQLAKIRAGQLTVQLGGQTLLLRGTAPGPGAHIAVLKPAALLRRLFWRGDLGFAEAFMAGEWRSNDLAGLLELLALNLEDLARSDRRSWFARGITAAQHYLNRNTRRGSRRNIAAHYDLGNRFYGQWLDPSMTYSSAIYDRSLESSEPLEQAQQRKYARMLEIIDPLPGETVLEIGCGWGGFAEYAARRGFRVIGLTLSQEQLAYARTRIERAGLSDRVELRLCDYRDFSDEVDHIVSIEMFEAVGQAYWQGYFATLERCLRPGGRAALQVITIDESCFDGYVTNPGGFIQRYIFPGGMLPTRSHLQQLGAEAGLQQQAMDGFAEDYADTLAEWHRRFDTCTQWLDDNGYDLVFRRMWRYYLAFCEAGFRARQLDVVQGVWQKA